MATSDRKPRDVLKSNLKEPMKFYMVYDGSSRLSEVYEAPAGADHGDPALKTTYTYVSTSTRVQKMLEELSTWDSSYDI